MTEFCTTCGGAPHADGEELAGPRGHFTTWGRLAPQRPLYAAPLEEETVPDGPTMVSELMPAGAPKNALWLARVPTSLLRVVESKGVWKGTEQHVLGVAGICEGDVRFYSRWKMATKGWASDAHWLRVDGASRTVSWNELRGELRERVGGI